jgi:DNA-binding NarL/FixJ family response regulator
MARTVLIVDDHAAFRASARAVLEADGYDVIGEAEDGESGLRLAVDLRPSIVLLDIALPGMDGFAVAERLAMAPQPPAVVLISSRERSDYGRRIDTTPARGFLSKRHLSGPALAALVG